MEFFAPHQAPARLTRLREKLDAMQHDGVDRVVLLPFGARLAAMGAHDFVQELLVDGLGTRFLLVGDDFRFGRGREGDFALLEAMGREHGYTVQDLNTVTHGGERVSSTRIREALARGDLGLARHLLGRPYRICGRIGHGDKRGRTIGYPTANINLHRRVSPLRGVYAVTLGGVANSRLPGVANIGTRPTVGGDLRHLLEVHLFGFSGDLYGRHAQVEFCLKLRDERKFDSFPALKAQIDLDAVAAREFLGVAGAP